MPRPLTLTLAATLAVLVSMAAPACAEAREQTLYAAGFERGLGSWGDIQRFAGPRIRTSRSVVRSGRRAARFEVRAGEQVRGNGGARAELSDYGELVGEGQTRIYRWSTYFPRSYRPDERWMDFLQWKNEGTGSPPLQMGGHGDEIGMYAGEQHGPWATVWKTRLVRGRWYDFRADIRWSESARHGRVSLWVNGRRVLRGYRMATLYRGLRNYLKIGLYRHEDIGHTQVLFHDRLRVSRRR